MNIRSVSRSLILPLAVALLAIPAAAADFKVPSDDFPTIGDALAAPGLTAGDRILVSGKQVFTESVTVTVAGIELIGKNAQIDPQVGGPGISVAADGVTVSGFTIRNGVGGIVVTGDNVTVTKCKVLACLGTGIDVTGDGATITRNEVALCEELGINYVAVDDTPLTTIADNTVQLNKLDGIFAAGGRMLIDGNRVEFNGDSGICVDTFGFVVPFTDIPRIIGNRLDCNGFHGIHVAEAISGIRIEDNRVERSDANGIVVDVGTRAEVVGNQVVRNAEVGIQITTDFSTVEDNKVSDNGDAGILAANFSGGNNTIHDNQVKANGRDGIEVRGFDNTITENTCQKNFGDGIDLDSPDTGNEISDNTCKGNLHEGIDNSGLGTKINRNNATGNGNKGMGPDIAGSGNGGVGTVAEFVDNKTGNKGVASGPGVPQLIDI